MTDQRPDPDQLLNHIREEEVRARRGKLKIFFGALAGVGKTYAMLLAARPLREQGVDVVVGLVETHSRQETAALLDGLEVLPRQEIPYRERVLREFDLDGALARRPALILVNELAHKGALLLKNPSAIENPFYLLAPGWALIPMVLLTSSKFPPIGWSSSARWSKSDAVRTRRRLARFKKTPASRLSPSALMIGSHRLFTESLYPPLPFLHKF